MLVERTFVLFCLVLACALLPHHSFDFSQAGRTASEQGSLEEHEQTQNQTESKKQAVTENAFSFEQLQRSVNISYVQPLTRNDFRLAMLFRLGHLKESDCASIDALFDALVRLHTVLSHTIIHFVLCQLLTTASES